MLLLGVVQAQAAGDVSLGSYDLLATEILTSATASVTFSSLGDYAADYQHLQIRYTFRDTTASDFAAILINFNSDSTSSYAEHILRSDPSGSVVSQANTSQTRIRLGAVMGGGATANAFSGGLIDILDPFETTKNTTIRTMQGRNTASNQTFVQMNSGLYYKTDAITAITIAPESGSIAANSRFSLYGIKAV